MDNYQTPTLGSSAAQKISTHLKNDEVFLRRPSLLLTKPLEKFKEEDKKHQIEAEDDNGKI